MPEAYSYFDVSHHSVSSGSSSSIAALTSLGYPLLWEEVFINLSVQAAPFAAIVVFMAPFPTIRQISKDRSVGKLPLLPYTTMILNNFIWVTYGFLKHQPKLWSSYSIGLVLSTYYFLEYIKYYTPVSDSDEIDKKRKKKASLWSKTLPGTIKLHMQICFTFVICVLVVIQIVPSSLSSSSSSTTTTNEDNSEQLAWVKIFGSSGMNSITSDMIIGNLGVILCIMMYASPLIVIKECLRKKSAKLIPLPFTLAACFNCFVWTIVGVKDMNDSKIYVPSLLGFFFGCIQLYLKFIFYYSDNNSQNNITISNSMQKDSSDYVDTDAYYTSI